MLCVRVWEGEAVCEGRVCVCECVKGDGCGVQGVTLESGENSSAIFLMG